MIGFCIDCGEPGELRLPERFPHVCAGCLFPPAPPMDASADLLVDGHERPFKMSVAELLRVKTVHSPGFLQDKIR